MYFLVVYYLASRLKDVSHRESPVRCPLFAHVVTVVRVPVEAELGEAEQLEDGLGLPVDLGLLPLAVRRLRNERLKAEAGGDGCARQGRAVLVSDVHPDMQQCESLFKLKKWQNRPQKVMPNKAVQSSYQHNISHILC